jgi:hypothetical protein
MLALHGAEAREAGVVNHLYFPFGIHARAPSEFLVSRAKLPRGVSYVSPVFPAPFLRLAPSLKAASSREIVLRLAAQESRPRAPSVPMRSAPAYFLCKWGV